jgi:hypothetical protein
MSVDRQELFKLVLEVFRDERMLTKSGCETRLNATTCVVFAKRTVYTELGKRCLLNLECYQFLRRLLLAFGPVKELHCIRDKLIHMIAMCLKDYLYAPFDVHAPPMICAFNRAKIDTPGISFAQNVVQNTFEDHMEPSDLRVLMVKTTIDRPHRMKIYCFQYEYPADNEAAGTKRLSEANKERVVAACMQAFLTPDAVSRFVSEFYLARRRIEDKERERLFKRRLARFTLANDAIIERIADPGAEELEFDLNLNE